MRVVVGLRVGGRILEAEVGREVDDLQAEVEAPRRESSRRPVRGAEERAVGLRDALPVERLDRAVEREVRRRRRLALARAEETVELERRVALEDRSDLASGVPGGS